MAFRSTPYLLWDYTFVSVANPGAGNQFLYTVPQQTFLEPVKMSYTFTTSATVINRTTYFTFGLVTPQGVKSIAIGGNWPLQGASVTRPYDLIAGITAGGLANCNSFINPGLTNTLQSGMPQRFILTPGSTLTSTVTNMQAGDTITGIALIFRAYHSLQQLASQ